MITYPIDPKQITQKFGENPAAYARFGLKGHNGIDFRTIYADTPAGRRNILASFLSRYYNRGNEGNDGFGLYFEILVQLKSLWKLTYAHCASIENFQNKNEGEIMAISDNSGNSTASHLHLTTKKGKIVNGVFVADNYNNGFFGAVDPEEFFNEVQEVKSSGQVPANNPMNNLDIQRADLANKIINTLHELVLLESSASENYIKTDADKAKVINAIKDLKKDRDNQAQRAGKYDQVVQHYFPDADSNKKTPQDIFDKAGGAVDEDSIREDQKAKDKQKIIDHTASIDL